MRDFIIWRSISMRAGPDVLQCDWLKAGPVLMQLDLLLQSSLHFSIESSVCHKNNKRIKTIVRRLVSASFYQL